MPGVRLEATVDTRGGGSGRTEMNDDPVARHQRQYFRISEFIVAPEWKAIMSEKRAAHAPAPYRPALRATVS